MPKDTREVRAEGTPVVLAWGMPSETREGAFPDVSLWLSGAASLLLWTAIALLLTSTRTSGRGGGRIHALPHRTRENGGVSAGACATLDAETHDARVSPARPPDPAPARGPSLGFWRP
jgi:hypothetical protein